MAERVERFYVMLSSLFCREQVGLGLDLFASLLIEEVSVQRRVPSELLGQKRDHIGACGIRDLQQHGRRWRRGEDEDEEEVTAQTPSSSSPLSKFGTFGRLQLPLDQSDLRSTDQQVGAHVAAYD